MTQPTIFSGGEAGDEAILPLDNFYNYLDDKLDSLARNTMIDYERMTDCFISALSTLTVSMSAKEVGRLTSKYSEQEINSRTNRLNRLGGDTIV